ncbi:spexin-like [Arapaima gigas]
MVSCSGTKQNKLNAKNWGPQSMMYLKGKYGRRFAQDYEEDNVYKPGLNNWFAVIKGFQHRKPVEVRKIRGLMASENFVLRYLK